MPVLTGSRKRSKQVLISTIADSIHEISRNHCSVPESRVYPGVDDVTIYHETQQKPTYVVREVLGGEPEEVLTP